MLIEGPQGTRVQQALRSWVHQQIPWALYRKEPQVETCQETCLTD